MATQVQIAQILNNFDADESANRLVSLANLQGGEDNVTAVVVEIT